MVIWKDCKMPWRKVCLGFSLPSKIQDSKKALYTCQVLGLSWLECGKPALSNLRPSAGPITGSEPDTSCRWPFGNVVTASRSGDLVVLVGKDE